MLDDARRVVNPGVGFCGAAYLDNWVLNGFDWT